MVGPPGSGKTLLARTVPSILPPLGLIEALEVTRLYSVSGMLSADRPLITSRLFRAPHHTTSHAGLGGGGRWPRPGEISLAHRGVLFLEVLRQPLTSCSASRYTANDLLIYPWMPPTRHYVTMLRMPGDAGEPRSLLDIVSNCLLIMHVVAHKNTSNARQNRERTLP